MHSPRRKIILIASAATTVLAMFVIVVIEPFEPRYQGLKASAFVLQMIATNRFGSEDIRIKLKPMGAALAVPALANVAEREDSLLRRWYQQAYLRLPPGLRRHLPPPKSNHQVILNAVIALGSFGPDARSAVPTLERIYRRGDEFMRLTVVQTLSRVGLGAQSAVPTLLGGLASTNQQFLRISTIRALPLIDAAGSSSATALSALLQDTDEQVATLTVTTLGAMTQRSPSLISNSWTALSDPRLAVSSEAARELRKFDALTLEALQPFIGELESPQSSERLRAATVLAHGGRFAPDLLPPLLRAAKDPDEKVHDAVFRSLSAFAWEPGVVKTCRLEAAREVLSHGNENQGWLTMNVLPQLEPEAAALVPLLMRALRHESSRMRGKAAETLGKLGPAARDASAELVKLWQDEWFIVRDAATNALKRIGE